MRFRIAGWLRDHWHVLLIVPLVVIATTWPTFPRIFDADEFWLHGMQHDKWLKLWDAWHLERALSGQAYLYFTDLMYHPQGQSLAFQAFAFPHALLLIALKTMLPVDDAYNLNFLLMLCFNAFCGYALVRYLIKDKWIALFGAVVFAVATPFPYGSTIPEFVMMGTLPLTAYFYLRAVTERRRLFAGLAGLCAGITAFIGVYPFAFVLLTVGILALIKLPSLWKQSAFWGVLLISVFVWATLSLIRFYPMLTDEANLNLAMERHQDQSRSSDLLDHFVLKNNPFTANFLGSLFNYSHDHEPSIIKREYKNAYLGYINIVLIACAFLFLPRRGRLLPWIVILVFFAILRLGDYLTLSGTHYTDIILPGRRLRDWFPVVFRNIGRSEIYQIGVVMPVAVLSCYGLASLVQLKPVKTRILLALLCTIIVAFEFYVPRLGQRLEGQETAFVGWLQSEPEDQIKLIQLPLADIPSRYYLYVQTLSGFPHANGSSNRLLPTTRHKIDSNLLLETWDHDRGVHCLPHNEQSFLAALDQLLADGFTHIVVHNWLYGAEFIVHSFKNVPPAYDNGFVSVYRLGDMRLSCQNQAAELPRFIRFAQSSAAMPGAGTSILSLHPSQAIDADLFEYLGSLYSDWRSLVHLYLEDGEVVMQSAGQPYADLNAMMNDNQVMYFLYNTHETDPDLLIGNATFDGFNLCLREATADGAVIERYVSHDFSCDLVASDSPFKVHYDNGIRLENLLVQTDQDVLDLQLMWSNLPDEAHSVSIQVFNASGEKVFGQDAVIDHLTLDRRRSDISSLPAGDYRVKLILYSFETGATVGGEIIEDGARFDRELPIATVDRL